MRILCFIREEIEDRRGKRIVHDGIKFILMVKESVPIMPVFTDEEDIRFDGYKSFSQFSPESVRNFIRDIHPITIDMVVL